MPKGQRVREAHNSFVSQQPPSDRHGQRHPKRSRDSEADMDGDVRSNPQPRSLTPGAPSMPPPPPPRKAAALPPPPPAPSGAPSGAPPAPPDGGRVHSTGRGRRRRTGWEPAQPAPAHPADAMRSEPMPEAAVVRNGQGLPGPPTAAPQAPGSIPPGQPQAKNFGLSGVLAAETKRNEGGHIQKYAEPADAAVPGPGWRLYIYKGAHACHITLIADSASCFFGVLARGVRGDIQLSQ